MKCSLLVPFSSCLFCFRCNACQTLYLVFLSANPLLCLVGKFPRSTDKPRGKRGAKVQDAPIEHLLVHVKIGVMQSFAGVEEAFRSWLGTNVEEYEGQAKQPPGGGVNAIKYAWS